MRARTHAGFTLVELLVGLSIIGLISILLFSGLRMGQRAWESTDARAQRTADLRLAREFLRDSLMRARPVKWRVDQGALTLFWGDQRRLEWVSPLPDHAGYGGLSLWRLEVADSGPGPRLVLRRWMYGEQSVNANPAWTPLGRSLPLGMMGAENNTLYSEHVLVSDVTEFSIRYLDRGKDDDQRWLDAWLDQPGLPGAVALRIHVAGASWPDLTVRLPDEAKRSAVRPTSVSQEASE